MIHDSFHGEMVLFLFFLLGLCKSRGQTQREGEINEIGVHDGEFTKNQYKVRE